MDTKSILSSKTFWGSIIALVAVMFPHIYTNLGLTDANSVGVVDKIVGGLGGALAFYGRFAATTAVTLTGK